ncbi:MAG: hypothetical protein ACLFN2_05300 [Bacteroidales bacterium]
MEELVYIVLIVVWLLVSFLKRKPGKGDQAGKQQPSARGEEAAPAEEMDMEDMLEEFFGGGKKKNQEDQPAREPVYETKERSYRQGRDESFRGEETVWERESADREGESSDWEQYEGEEKSHRKGYENFEGASARAPKIEDEAASVDKVRTIEELIRSHKKEEAMRQAREEEHNAGDSQSEGVPEFDLRQAVIFSEILNRKDN